MYTSRTSSSFDGLPKDIRLKLSGMGWKNQGAQWILSLRTILLSSIWSTTYDMHIASLENLMPLPYAPSAYQHAKIAA